MGILLHMVYVKITETWLVYRPSLEVGGVQSGDKWFLCWYLLTLSNFGYSHFLISVQKVFLWHGHTIKIVLTCLVALLSYQNLKYPPLSLSLYFVQLAVQFAIKIEYYFCNDRPHEVIKVNNYNKASYFIQDCVLIL